MTMTKASQMKKRARAAALSWSLRLLHRANDRVFLYAFDLIELNGDDMRRDPLEVRKATLLSLIHI